MLSDGDCQSELAIEGRCSKVSAPLALWRATGVISFIAQAFQNALKNPLMVEGVECC